MQHPPAAVVTAPGSPQAALFGLLKIGSRSSLCVGVSVPQVLPLSSAGNWSAPKYATEPSGVATRKYSPRQTVSAPADGEPVSRVTVVPSSFCSLNTVPVVSVSS